MCKLLIGFKANNSQDKKFEEIIRAQEHTISKEPHGISALIVNKDNTIEVMKELDEYGKVFMWVYSKIKDAKIVAIHSRQSTGGLTDRNNLHFFDVDNYFLAHNGIVGEYSSYNRKIVYTGKEQKVFFSEYEDGEFEGLDRRYQGIPEKVIKAEEELVPQEETFSIVMDGQEILVPQDNMCDTFKFLFNLPKPVNKTILHTEMKEKDFSGVATLVDKDRKKVFIFSTREIKAHMDFKNYMFLYSYEPNNNLMSQTKFFGIPILLKEKSENLKTYTVPTGVYELGFDSIKVEKKK